MASKPHQKVIPLNSCGSNMARGKAYTDAVAEMIAKLRKRLWTLRGHLDDITMSNQAKAIHQRNYDKLKKVFDELLKEQ